MRKKRAVQVRTRLPRKTTASSRAATLIRASELRGLSVGCINLATSRRVRLRELIDGDHFSQVRLSIVRLSSIIHRYISDASVTVRGNEIQIRIKISTLLFNLILM